RNGAEKSLIDALRKGGARLDPISSWGAIENWTLTAPPALVDELADVPAVVWIEPHRDYELHGERGALSLTDRLLPSRTCVTGAGGGYAQWLTEVNLDGQGVVVQVMDDGLSRGNASNQPGTAHPDIVGRIAGIDNPTS